MKLTADNIHESLTKLGNTWADADADAERLEKNEKILFSELVLRSAASSIAAKEHEARASEEYQTHVEGMVEARRIANRAKVALNNARDWLDWKRTEAATERATLRSAP
jgi:hypothetical protein